MTRMCGSWKNLPGTLYIPYIAKPALVTLTQLSHTCPCETLITFYSARATAGKFITKRNKFKPSSQQPPMSLSSIISWAFALGQYFFGKSQEDCNAWTKYCFSLLTFLFKEKAFRRKVKLRILSLPQMDVSLLLEF